MKRFFLPVSGIETEYGVAMQNGITSFQLTQNFFESTVVDPIAWDYSSESPTSDARTPWRSSGMWTESIDKNKEHSMSEHHSKKTSFEISYTSNALSTILLEAFRVPISADEQKKQLEIALETLQKFQSDLANEDIDATIALLNEKINELDKENTYNIVRSL